VAIGAIVKFVAILKGKKTYILSILGILSQIVLVINGDITVVDLLTGEHLLILLNSLGLGTLRAGVSKLNGK